MPMNDDFMIFHRNFWEAIKHLPEEERLKALTAIIEYGLTGEEQDVDGIAGAIYNISKRPIDIDRSNRRNGARGGRPKNEPVISERGVIENEKTPLLQNEKTPLSKFEKPPFSSEKENEKETEKEKTKEKVAQKERKREKEKEKEKEKERTFCAEPETAPRSRSAGAFALNDGSMYNVTENDVEYFQKLYPGIDCMQELRKIEGWCESNPKNRKTRAGAKRFLNNWLSRAQDRAPVQRDKCTQKAAPNRFKNFDERATDYDSMLWDNIKYGKTKEDKGT